MRVVSYREGTIAAKTEGMGYTTLINPYFTRWTNQIELCLATRDPKKLVRSLKARGMNDICEEDIWGYRKGELRELYLECMRHSAEYSAPLCGKDLLIVSHPTYIHGSHVRHIDTDERRDSVEEYEANIQRLFASRLVLAEVDILLMDTIHHYAAATSLLLESGLVDAASFTEYDSGWLVDPAILESSEHENIYVCGNYNGRCLGAVFEQATHLPDVEHTVWAIQELIMNNPLFKTLESLQAGVVFAEEWRRPGDIPKTTILDPDNVVSIDDLIGVEKVA